MLGMLTYENRRLLVVNPLTDCDVLAPALFNDHWIIELTDSISSIEPIYDACILFLQQKHLENLEPIKDMIRSSRTEWVAVIDTDLKKNKSLAGFIYEWFFDFHTLPFDTPRIICTLGRAAGMARLCYGRNEIIAQDSGTLIGESLTMRKLRTLVEKISLTGSTVLITGESGTGKELVAKSLHRQSQRSASPFIAINCGAIPENLIQSELFGHEKGAFTGAYQRKIGRIESAEDGTLFLDEIGDLPSDMQANLLRFLQEGTFERVGGRESIRTNVRILAATHVDLEQAIKERKFREDLYYRINVLNIHTMALRDHKEDITALTEHFSNLYSIESGKRAKRLSNAAITALINHDWPGNIRELANRIRRGQVLAEGKQVEPSDMGFNDDTVRPCRLLEDYLHSAEQQALKDALMHYSTNMSNAARSLGVSRPTLYRLLHKHQLR